MKYLLLLTAFCTASFAETVKLTPPEMNIRSQIACNRPMRAGRFNISTEKDSGKTIVNCLGHGGSGYTTLFGSVNKAIRLFEELPDTNKSTPIRIIGSGCMGLACATELSRLGYTVSGITTEERYDIASWRATGYFALVSIKTSPEDQAELNEIGMDTFQAYNEVAAGKHPFLKSNIVRLIPVYSSKDTDVGIEDLEARGLIPPHEDVTLDFGNGVIYEDFAKNMTYFMDVTSMMRQFTAKVEELNIPIEMKTVKSFADLDESVIFNCSGLGGRVLNQDIDLIPVRGHLLMLDESAGTDHMDYMIYTKDPNFEGRYIYLFPKRMTVTSADLDGYGSHGLLGGTFIPLTGNESVDELEALDKKEYADLRNRNALFFTGKAIEE
jgi:hypothetical protein